MGKGDSPRFDWHPINNDAGLEWMRRFLPMVPYTAFTRFQRDRSGRRICFIGEPENPQEEKPRIRPQAAFRFASEAIADAAQEILEENCK
jgi:hypothetical protein